MIAAYLLSLSLLTTPTDSLPTVGSVCIIDTGKVVDTARVAKFRIRPTFNLDFRNSFLENQRINVWGINGGITYGTKRHQLTLGYYWINYATYLRLINWHRNVAQHINLDYYTRTDMWFASLMYWRNFINTPKWMLSIPIEVGGGVANDLPISLSKEVPIDRSRKSFLVPLQVGVYGHWKASRWGGASAQFGYRYAIFRTAVNQNFNGSYYSVGVSVYPAFLLDVLHWVKTGDSISPFRPPRHRKK